MTKSIFERASETAKKIRLELKESFPDLPANHFKVTSSTYSGGSSIYISYVDYPSYEEVDKLARRFNSASYDGMVDLETRHGYSYKGIKYSGASYISVSKEYSAEREQAIKELLNYFGDENSKAGFGDYRKNHFDEMLDRKLNYIGRQEIPIEHQAEFKAVKFGEIEISKDILVENESRIYDKVIDLYVNKFGYNYISDLEPQKIKSIQDFTKEAITTVITTVGFGEQELKANNFEEIISELAQEILENYVDDSKRHEVNVINNAINKITQLKKSGVPYSVKDVEKILENITNEFRTKFNTSTDIVSDMEAYTTQVLIAEAKPLKVTKSEKLVVEQLYSKVKLSEKSQTELTNVDVPSLEEYSIKELEDKLIAMKTELFESGEFSKIDDIVFYFKDAMETELLKKYDQNIKAKLNEGINPKNVSKEKMQAFIDTVIPSLKRRFREETRMTSGIILTEEEVELLAVQPTVYIIDLYEIMHSNSKNWKDTSEEEKKSIYTKRFLEDLGRALSAKYDKRILNKEVPEMVKGKLKEIFGEIARPHYTDSEIQQLLSSEFKEKLERIAEKNPVISFADTYYDRKMDMYYEEAFEEIKEFVIDNLEYGYEEFDYNLQNPDKSTRIPYAVFQEYRELSYEKNTEVITILKGIEDDYSFEMINQIKNNKELEISRIIDKYYKSNNADYRYEVPAQLYTELDEFIENFKQDVENMNTKVIPLPRAEDTVVINNTDSIKSLLNNVFEEIDLAYKNQSIFTAKNSLNMVKASTEFREILSKYKHTELEDESELEKLIADLTKLIEEAFKVNIRAIYLNTQESDLIQQRLNETEEFKLSSIELHSLKAEFLEKNQESVFNLKEVPITTSIEVSNEAKRKNAEKVVNVFFSWLKDTHPEYLTSNQAETENMEEFIQGSIANIKALVFKPFEEGRLINSSKESILGESSVVSLLNRIHSGEITEPTQMAVILESFKNELIRLVDGLTNTQIKFTEEEITVLLTEVKNYIANNNTEKFMLFDVDTLKRVIDAYNGTYYFTHKRLIPNGTPKLSELVSGEENALTVKAYALKLVTQIAKNHAIEAVNKREIKYSSILDFEDDLNRYLKQAKSKAVLEVAIDKQIPFVFDELLVYASNEVAKLVNAIKVEDNISSDVVDEITDEIANKVNARYYAIVNEVKNKPSEGEHISIIVNKGFNIIANNVDSFIRNNNYEVEPNSLAYEKLKEYPAILAKFKDFETYSTNLLADVKNAVIDSDVILKYAMEILDVIEIYTRSYNLPDSESIKQEGIKFLVETKLRPTGLNSSEIAVYMDVVNNYLAEPKNFKNSNKKVVKVSSQDLLEYFTKASKGELVGESSDIFYKFDDKNETFGEKFKQMFVDLLVTRQINSQVATPNSSTKFKKVVKKYAPIIVDYFELKRYEEILNGATEIKPTDIISKYIYDKAFEDFVQNSNLEFDSKEEFDDLYGDILAKTDASKIYENLVVALDNMGTKDKLLNSTFEDLMTIPATTAKGIKLKELFISQILPELVSKIAKQLARGYKAMTKAEGKPTKPSKTVDEKINEVVEEALNLVNHKLNNKYFVQGTVEPAHILNVDTVVGKEVLAIKEQLNSVKFTLGLKGKLVKQVAEKVLNTLNDDLKPFVKLEQTIPEKYRGRYTQALKGAIGRQTKKGKLSDEFKEQLLSNLFSSEVVNKYFFSDFKKIPTIVFRENLEAMDNYVEDTIKEVVSSGKEPTEIREIKSLKGKAKIKGVNNNALKNYIKDLALEIMSELEDKQNLKVTNEDKLNIVKFYTKRVNIIHFTDIANEKIDTNPEMSLNQIMKEVNKEEISYFLTTPLIRNIVARNTALFEEETEEDVNQPQNLNLSIEESLRIANTDTILIEFVKRDGSVRKMLGSFSESAVHTSNLTPRLKGILENLRNPIHQTQSLNNDLVEIFDVEKQEMRSFKPSTIITIKHKDRQLELNDFETRVTNTANPRVKSIQDMISDLDNYVVRIMFEKQSNGVPRIMFATRNEDVIRYYAEKHDLNINFEEVSNFTSQGRVIQQVQGDYIRVFSLDAKGFRTFKPSTLFETDVVFGVGSYMMFPINEVSWEKCLEGEKSVSEYAIAESFDVKSDAPLLLDATKSVEPVTNEDIQKVIKSVSIRAKDKFSIEKSSPITSDEFETIVNFFVSSENYQYIKKNLAEINSRVSNREGLNKGSEIGLLIEELVDAFFAQFGYKMLDEIEAKAEAEEEELYNDEDDDGYIDGNLDDDMILEHEDVYDDTPISILRSVGKPLELTIITTMDIPKLVNVILVDDTKLNSSLYDVSTEADKALFKIAVVNVIKTSSDLSPIKNRIVRLKNAVELGNVEEAQQTYNMLIELTRSLVKAEYDARKSIQEKESAKASEVTKSSEEVTETTTEEPTEEKVTVQGVLYTEKDTDIRFNNINYNELFYYLDSKDFLVTVQFIKKNGDFRVINGTCNKDIITSKSNFSSNTATKEQIVAHVESNLAEIIPNRMTDLTNKKVVHLFELDNDFRQFKPQNLIAFTVEDLDRNPVFTRVSSEETVDETSNPHYSPKDLTPTEMYEILQEKVVRLTVKKVDGSLRTMIVSKNSELISIYFQRDVETVKFNAKSLETPPKTSEQNKAEQLAKNLFTVIDLQAKSFKSFNPTKVEDYDLLGDITTWLEFDPNKDAWFDVAFNGVDAKQFEVLGEKEANDANYPSNPNRAVLEAEYKANAKLVEDKLEALKQAHLARKAQEEKEAQDALRAITPEVREQRLAITQKFVQQAGVKINLTGGFFKEDDYIYNKALEYALNLHENYKNTENEIDVRTVERLKIIIIEHGSEMIFINPRYIVNGVSFKVYVDNVGEFKYGQGNVLTASLTDKFMERDIKEIFFGLGIPENKPKNPFLVKLDNKDITRIKRFDELIKLPDVKSAFTATFINPTEHSAPQFQISFKEKNGTRNLLFNPAYVFDLDKKRIIYKRESANTTLKDFVAKFSTVKPDKNNTVLDGISAQNYATFFKVCETALNLRKAMPKPPKN